MIAATVNLSEEIEQYHMTMQHVRRWLELFLDGTPGGSLDAVLAATENHPGHADDATTDTQWDLWLRCLDALEAL